LVRLLLPDMACWIIKAWRTGSMPCALEGAAVKQEEKIKAMANAVKDFGLLLESIIWIEPPNACE